MISRQLVFGLPGSFVTLSRYSAELSLLNPVLAEPLPASHLSTPVAVLPRVMPVFDPWTASAAAQLGVAESLLLLKSGLWTPAAAPAAAAKMMPAFDLWVAAAGDELWEHDPRDEAASEKAGCAQPGPDQATGGAQGERWFAMSQVKVPSQCFA